MKSSGSKKLWAIHSWVGFYFGIVIAVLSVSGAAALFKDELDELLNPPLHHVAAVHPAGSQASLTAVVAREQAALPGFTFSFMELPQRADGPWVLMFYAKQKGPFGDTENRQIFVDPYTGKILGSRDYYKTFAFFLRNLHVRLFESNWGRQIVGLAGVALAVVSVTGLLIYGSFMKKQVFGAFRTRNLRTLTADWHKFVGVTAFAFNLMIAVTGTWLGLQPKIMKWTGLKAPSHVAVAKLLDADADAALPVDYEQVLRQARLALPAMQPAQIEPSTEGEGYVEVSGDIPGLVYEPHINKVAVDKRTGAVLHVYDVRQQAPSHKLWYMQEALHFGSFAGLWLKVVYCLFALTSGALSITGFVLYLKRNQKKSTHAEARPAANNKSRRPHVEYAA